MPERERIAVTKQFRDFFKHWVTTPNIPVKSIGQLITLSTLKWYLEYKDASDEKKKRMIEEQKVKVFFRIQGNWKLSKEETEKLTNWQFAKYVLIGVAIAIVYTLVFIVVVDLSEERVKVTDFPLELFDEGYDILCIDDKGCLIKINENMTWGADQEKNQN